VSADKPAKKAEPQMHPDVSALHRILGVLDDLGDAARERVSRHLVDIMFPKQQVIVNNTLFVDPSKPMDEETKRLLRSKFNSRYLGSAGTITS
jgi:hypothetical protein